jgi:hypothetical protein
MRLQQCLNSLASGCLAVLLAGCGGGDESKDNTRPPAKVDATAKTEMREVWLQVDGMSERLKIV